MKMAKGANLAMFSKVSALTPRNVAVEIHVMFTHSPKSPYSEQILRPIVAEKETRETAVTFKSVSGPQSKGTSQKHYSRQVGLTLRPKDIERL